MDFNTAFAVRFNDEQHMWRYELHPPHLVNVATLPFETENTENVILQWDITKENFIKCIVYASSKWTCRLWNSGSCYAAMRVRNKDLWHLCLWHAKTLGANLGWLWTQKVRVQDFFNFHHSNYDLRGHCYKLATKRSRLEVRRNFFRQRVVSPWNRLPSHVVEATELPSRTD